MDIPSPRKIGFSFLSLLVLAAVLFAAYIWLAFSWSYSSGERAGFIQKVSKKGWVCKTWEGELAMVAMPGAMPEKFFFTVRDDAVAEKLNILAGQRVTVDYKQHKGLPGNCFGETEYFVYDVKALAQ